MTNKNHEAGPPNGVFVGNTKDKTLNQEIQIIF